MQFFPGRPAAVSPFHPARPPRERTRHRDLVGVLAAPRLFDQLRQPARHAPILPGGSLPDPERGLFGQRDRDVFHGARVGRHGNRVKPASVLDGMTPLWTHSSASHAAHFTTALDSVNIPRERPRVRGDDARPRSGWSRLTTAGPITTMTMRLGGLPRRSVEHRSPGCIRVFFPTPDHSRGQIGTGWRSIVLEPLLISLYILLYGFCYWSPFTNFERGIFKSPNIE